MEAARRIFSLTFCIVFLWTPAAEQLACFFCGPSPETSVTAKAVSHMEDECLLQDGFHREDPTSETGPMHIHFCTLHATFVALTQTLLVEPIEIYSLFQNSHNFFESLAPIFLYHPPKYLDV
ncbi:MAG: hypothetical protein O6826_01665 [Acidobacteria bacterium]|nr:hypothetical protein [Acidobacteriota bacterium]